MGHYNAIIVILYNMAEISDNNEMFGSHCKILRPNIKCLTMQYTIQPGWVTILQYSMRYNNTISNEKHYDIIKHCDMLKIAYNTSMLQYKVRYRFIKQWPFVKQHNTIHNLTFIGDLGTVTIDKLCHDVP